VDSLWYGKSSKIFLPPFRSYSLLRVEWEKAKSVLLYLLVALIKVHEQTIDTG
uniref:Uncharacterized protein n=1 Tax=Amphimedon queenslandica TaxID=400682 RepID=A0A1X7VQ49_AMPQE